MMVKSGLEFFWFKILCVPSEDWQGSYMQKFGLFPKDFRASELGQVRRLTAATAAITLAGLFVEMLCYLLGRLHSSCVLSTRINLTVNF